MRYEWSGVLLLTPDNKVIAMHRDDIPTIRDPGKYGVFGGAAENDETPIEAALREIEEETNLRPQSEDFELFKVYEQVRDNLPVPAKLSIFVLRDVDPASLITHEGQGIKILKDAEDPNIATDVREAFVDWFAQQHQN